MCIVSKLNKAITINENFFITVSPKPRMRYQQPPLSQGLQQPPAPAASSVASGSSSQPSA